LDFRIHLYLDAQVILYIFLGFFQEAKGNFPNSPLCNFTPEISMPDLRKNAAETWNPPGIGPFSRENPLPPKTLWKHPKEETLCWGR
jgi:hypothetical protein